MKKEVKLFIGLSMSPALENINTQTNLEMTSPITKIYVSLFHECHFQVSSLSFILFYIVFQLINKNNEWFKIGDIMVVRIPTCTLPKNFINKQTNKSIKIKNTFIGEQANSLTQIKCMNRPYHSFHLLIAHIGTT